MYFAKINNDNIVEKVIVADSKEWCEQNLDGLWIKAHDPLDAATGYKYDEENDQFIAPPVQLDEESETNI
jgi:hypothetical protein